MGNADIVGDVHRLIVFDLDGTLIDSRRDLAEAANQLLEELGGAPLREEDIGRMVGEGAALLVRRVLSAAGVAETQTALQRFLDLYAGRMLHHTRPYPGIPESVETARRHARVAVLTNKPADQSRRILAGLRLNGLLDDVVGGDGPWPRKPDPASLLALMERAHATPSSTLLVGDSEIDYTTAGRAAVRCCLAAWGFGYETFPRERLTADDWIAATPADLTRMLERWVAKF